MLRSEVRRPALVLAAIALVVPASAGADHPLGSIPWTTLLPPRPGAPAPTDPAIPCGAQATPACVDQVIEKMVADWSPLDASCDPNAVFALTYLITTKAFRTTFDPGYWDDQPWVINLDRGFADLYFEAIEGYEAGAAPPAWTIAFDAANGGKTNAVQDAFLGMNAHIHRDLPFALEAAGLVWPDGSSRKPDHDRVNEVLSDVLDEIQAELARRYDPLFSLSDASPSPADEIGALEMLKGWREEAWRNAERLTFARSKAERAVVVAQIEAYSALWATLIASPDFGWYHDRRQAYCAAAHQGTAP